MRISQSLRFPSGLSIKSGGNEERGLSCLIQREMLFARIQLEFQHMKQRSGKWISGAEEGETKRRRG